MSCQSDGMDVNQQNQVEQFGFSSKLKVYIVSEDEEEDETEVEDYGSILECFRDVKELNKLLPQNIKVVSLQQERMTWKVSSQEVLTQWLEAVTNRKLSNLLTEFAVDRGLGKRLSLQTGYRLDFEIFFEARDLKYKAKKHFQELRSPPGQESKGEPPSSPALLKPFTTPTTGTLTHNEVLAYCHIIILSCSIGC
ncbi:uncharacterized protein LOC124258748 [Haliotis rubra]|uniref:uncharacterized protein LOC124258748 n=1 Tax=Haliotis rubra TaxID=36100 RepID=UPI001EE5DCCD|nr:uncharacterized protein LOC124258748 [Haliotis rubra]